jgi:hypothetical protein
VLQAILAELAVIAAYIAGLIVRIKILETFNSWFEGQLRTGGAPIGGGSLMNEWFITYNSVLAQGALLANGEYGLVAAHTERQAILSAIGGLPYPPTPPSVPDIVDGVWDAIDPYGIPGPIAYGEEQHYASEWAQIMQGGGSVPAKHNAFFNISYPFVKSD